jgi:SMODS and SLOG-associating 2TM effector domain 1
MPKSLDNSVQVDDKAGVPADQARGLCGNQIDEFKKKADHNKRESLQCFIVIIASTLAAPLFVTLGSDWITGKLIPSILSLVAAGATSWLQLRKPQRLWSLYRTAQRQLEDHRYRYDFHLSPYSEEEPADKLLASNVADILMAVHNQWVPLIPSPDHLGQMAPSGRSDSRARK